MPPVSAIRIDEKILATVFESMGINVDVPSFFDKLAQEALKNPPQPPFPTVRFMGSGNPLPEYTSTTGPATLSPEDKAKRQKLIERARADLIMHKKFCDAKIKK